MPTLFTITGNLLAETTAAFDFPRVGQTVRARGKTSFQVGGKGVNVAKAYNLLSREKAFAAVFTAGFTGRRCLDFLEKSGFCNTLNFEIGGETRQGLVCRTSDGMETTFLGEDVPIPESAFAEALAEIEARARGGDFLAFCGSFAGWQHHYASEIAALCGRKKLRLCVDTYGKPLGDFAKENVFLLKINRDEYRSTFGADSVCADGIARAFPRGNVENLAITDSSRKIECSFGGGYFALTPPKIEREVSATGCGDALLGSLIFDISRGATLPDALPAAAARASASAADERTALWDEPLAQQLLKQWTAQF